jgi:hypothetical protein
MSARVSMRVSSNIIRRELEVKFVEGWKGIVLSSDSLVWLSRTTIYDYLRRYIREIYTNLKKRRRKQQQGKKHQQFGRQCMVIKLSKMVLGFHG